MIRLVAALFTAGALLLTSVGDASAQWTVDFSAPETNGNVQTHYTPFPGQSTYLFAGRSSSSPDLVVACWYLPSQGRGVIQLMAYDSSNSFRFVGSSANEIMISPTGNMTAAFCNAPMQETRRIIFDGQGGDDFLRIGGSDGQAYGRGGKDQIGGKGTRNWLQGDGNDDSIDSLGNDFIYAGSGNDCIHMQNPPYQLDCGSGTDKLETGYPDWAASNCERVNKDVCPRL